MTIDLKTRLMEKYLHSQGAALYHEGRLDEAVAVLEEAIALDDHSYTRCQLSLALKDKNNLRRALREMDRAVTLSPYMPRYYHERSRLHEMMGNEHGSRLDFQKAVELDGNYARIDEIREALESLENHPFFEKITALSRQKRINSQKLKEVLMILGVCAEPAAVGLEEMSCALPCPAFCCYFEGSPLLHGLSMGPWKLNHVRETLRQRGLAEKRFLERVDLAGQQEILRLIPPHHVLLEHGHPCVYAPKGGRSRLNPTLLASLPKGREYQDLVWIHGDSWGCSFLKEGRCMIHDVGGEPALPACKEFFCLTGFVFALLIQWDIVETGMLPLKTMKQLNRVAVDAALIMSAELYRADDLGRIRRSLEEAVSEAINRDNQGVDAETDLLVEQIQDLNQNFTRALKARKATIKRHITRMLDKTPIGEQA